MTLFGNLYSDQTFACFNSSSRFEERFKSDSGQCPRGTLKWGDLLLTSFGLSAWERGPKLHARGECPGQGALMLPTQLTLHGVAAGEVHPEPH